MMVVRMWFALRHESSSEWLCKEGTSGWQAGKTAGPTVPGMIVAQLESIRHERMLKDLVPAVLERLENYLVSRNGQTWFTVYLSCFLILHQVSYSTSSRARWARDNRSANMPLVSGYLRIPSTLCPTT